MAISGGKIRLLRPIAFADAIVWIGDVNTYSDVPRSVVIGARASATNAGGPSSFDQTVVIGVGASSKSNLQSVIIGKGAQCDFEVTNCIALGAGASVLNPTFSACVDVVVIGFNSQVTNLSFDSVALGAQSEIHDSFSALVVGYQAKATGSSQSVVIGTGATASYIPIVWNDASNYVVIGTGASANGANGVGNSAVVIGYYAISDHDGTSSVAIGLGAAAYSPHTVVLGGGSAIGINASGAIAVGVDQTAVGDGCVDSIAVGAQAKINKAGAVSPSTQAIALGYGTYCSDACNESIAIGPVSYCERQSGRAVVIGYASYASDGDLDENLSNSVVIGDNAWSAFQGSSPRPSVILGYLSYVVGSAIVIGTGYNGNRSALAFGGGIVIGNKSVSTRFVGSNFSTTIGNGSGSIDAFQTTIIGPRSTANTPPGVPFSLLLGYGNVSNDDVNYSGQLLVGSGNTVNSYSEGTSIFGISNTVSASAESLYMGKGITCTGGSWVSVFANDSTVNALTYGVHMGQFLDVNSSFSISLGFGVTNLVDNTMVVGGNGLGQNPIHSMVVHGYNGGDLLTFAVTDNPPNNEQTGLTIAYNTGAGIVNRDVYISATPPPGAIILYMTP